MRVSGLSISVGVICGFPFAAVGCATLLKNRRVDAPVHANIVKAERFKERLAAGDYEAARVMMTDDPRRWFGERQGAGAPWRIGPGDEGPWAAWDGHFRSRTQAIRWEADDRSATVTFRETNDYYRLLERGPQTSRATYFFTSDGLIEGLLIASVGERPPGRAEEFLAWAKEHHPAEIEYLMPGGQIDPSGDRPPRFRRLLNRWREAVGLPTIE